MIGKPASSKHPMPRPVNEYFKNLKLNEKTYDICIQSLNNIFNFYISGYPNIPDEYLYKNDGL